MQTAFSVKIPDYKGIHKFLLEGQLGNSGSKLILRRFVKCKLGWV